jgi:hypothetical protein
MPRDERFTFVDKDFSDHARRINSLGRACKACKRLRTDMSFNGSLLTYCELGNVLAEQSYCEGYSKRILATYNTD